MVIVEAWGLKKEQVAIILLCGVIVVIGLAWALSNLQLDQPEETTGWMTVGYWDTNNLPAPAWQIYTNLFTINESQWRLSWTSNGTSVNASNTAHFEFKIYDGSGNVVEEFVTVPNSELNSTNQDISNNGLKYFTDFKGTFWIKALFVDVTGYSIKVEEFRE